AIIQRSPETAGPRHRSDEDRLKSLRSFEPTEPGNFRLGRFPIADLPGVSGMIVVSDGDAPFDVRNLPADDVGINDFSVHLRPPVASLRILRETPPSRHRAIRAPPVGAFA